MKRHMIILSLMIIASCSKSLIPVEQLEENKYSLETKAIESNTYYWYRGEKIPLTINLQYVNIIIDGIDKKDTLLKRLSKVSDLNVEIADRGSGFLKIKLNESVRGVEEYQTKVREIKNKLNYGSIYPYYESENGIDPIGTSDLFYIRLKEEDKASLEKMTERYGVKIVNEVPYMPEWFVLSVNGSCFESSVDAANRFYESGLFADVDPAFMFDFKPSTVNDPMFNLQWGMNNTNFPGYDINIEGAWNITRGQGAKIAIVDNGVDNNHNELMHSFTSYSYDAGNGSSPDVFDPDLDHGTYVAGIMVAKANNNLHIAGVANEAKLMRVSHSLELGLLTAEKLASGISWAWLNGADVINCSWGDDDEYSYLHSIILETAIEDAMTKGRSNKGTVVVFCSGNNGFNSPIITYPGNYDDRILTVGAINNIGQRASFSGYGEKLDVVAPGLNILSTTNDNNIVYGSGTSAAAPHVSGIAALAISANPNLTREEVVWIIEQTAREIRPEDYLYSTSPFYQYYGTKNDELGHGLVDATMAVNIAQRFGLTAPSSSPRLDYFVASGAAAYYDDWIVMGNYTNAKIYFSLKYPQINSSYSYFWHLSTTGGSGLNPSFEYTGNDTGVIVNIQRPSYDSVLTVNCEVFSGSTYICTATFPLTIRLNFP